MPHDLKRCIKGIAQLEQSLATQYDMRGDISDCDPVVALIREWMVRQGMNRKKLGQQICKGGNSAKSLRRLDRLLAGEAVQRDFVGRVGTALQIPDQEVLKAWEARLSQIVAVRLEVRRKAEKRRIEQYGPHLWGIIPQGDFPNLITVVGPESLLLVRLSPEISELPLKRQIEVAGGIARMHFAEHRMCRLEGYEYRSSVNEVYLLNPDGESLGKMEGDL